MEIFDLENMRLRVKELMKERGMKMSDLAIKLNVNQSNLTKCLDGNPTLSRLSDIAEALDVSIQELFPEAPATEPIAPVPHVGVLNMDGKRFGLIPLEDDETKTLLDTLSLTADELEEKIGDYVKKCKIDGRTRAFFGIVSDRPVVFFYDQKSQRYLLLSQADNRETSILDYTRFFKVTDKEGTTEYEWEADELSRAMVEELLHTQ